MTDKDGNGKADNVDVLQRAESPLYDRNINMSGGGHVSSRKNVSSDDIYQHARSLHEITDQNSGGYSAYVDPVSGNANGKLVYTMEGNDDKIISTTHSLGNLRTVFVDNIKNLELITGNGNDVFVIGRDTGIIKWTGETVTVNTGGGNDIFIAGAGNNEHKVVASDDGVLRLEGAGYNAHNGEHIFDLSAYGVSYTGGGQIRQSGIHMGDGDDTFLSMGWKGADHSIEKSLIDMGAGNDNVTLYGRTADYEVNIKGGVGSDILNHNNGALSSKDISGFETLNLGNKSALKLYADYLTKDGGIEGGILKINGESGTSVDLGNNGNNGTWIKGEVKSEDGVNYHVYTHSANLDVQVWIDNDIKEVI